MQIIRRWKLSFVLTRQETAGSTLQWYTMVGDKWFCKLKKNSVSSLSSTDTLEMVPGARSKRWSSLPFFKLLSSKTFFTSSMYLINSLSLQWHEIIRKSAIELTGKQVCLPSNALNRTDDIVWMFWYESWKQVEFIVLQNLPIFSNLVRVDVNSDQSIIRSVFGS